MVKAKKVVIVGAGLAGLATAHYLQKANVPLSLFEARSRVGGRILTAKIADLPVELGAQTFTNPKKHLHLCRLIQDLNLEISENKSDLRYFYFDGENLSPTNILLNQAGDIEDNLRDLKEKCSNLKEVLEKLIEKNSPLYKVLVRRLAIYEGATLEKLSTRYIDALLHLLTDETSLLQVNHSSESFVNRLSIKGGNSLLPEKMAENLGHCLHLNKPLKQISKRDGIFSLTFEDGPSINADILVLAIPCSVYETIAIEQNVLPFDKLKAIQEISYGTNSKIIVPLSKLPSSTAGVISEYFFSNFDIERRTFTLHFSEEEKTSFKGVLQQAKPVLRSILGKNYALTDPVQAKDKSFVTYGGPISYNWRGDPFSKGTYSYISPGQDNLFTKMSEVKGEKFKQLFAPIQNLYFAGEHTSILPEALGTMEAACESGERTARSILQNLR